MENFKLMTVARTLGIEVDESQLHDALYDVKLTKEIYERCTINK
jgi:DNA polymerase-3 subunit epsilon